MYRTFSLLLFSAVAAHVASADEVRVLPSQFTLHGQQARQQLSVVAIRNDRIAHAILEKDLNLESSDPGVVKIEDGVAWAVGSGTASIVARTADGRQASASVRVVDADHERRWSFRNDVQSVFSKVGCNSGACHGALAGKGGFRLSLRGYDSETDYLSITRQARGRRIELADPGRSLILAKDDIWDIIIGILSNSVEFKL